MIEIALVAIIVFLAFRLFILHRKLDRLIYAASRIYELYHREMSGADRDFFWDRITEVRKDG